MPSTRSVAVDSPFRVTFFSIFRLPTAVLSLVNSAVGTLAVLFAVTATSTPFSPTSAMPVGLLVVSSVTV